MSEEEREVTLRDCILYALGTAACQVGLRWVVAQFQGLLKSQHEISRACRVRAASFPPMQDPLDEKDLRYCYEGSALGFSVLPTFATTLMPVASIFEGLDQCRGG